MILHTVFASLAFAALAIAAIASAVGILRNRQERLSTFLVWAAIAFLAAQVLTRSIAMGFPALTGMFESLVFFALAACAVTLIYEKLPAKQGREPSRGLRFGMIATAFLLLALASSPIAPKSVQPPMPALRSGWLVAHVALSFIGEAFFAVSFVASLLALGKGRQANGEAGGRHADLAYHAIVIGYPVFTIGALIFGAVWAQAAWGRFWSWDPKETWALVTWLVYTAYLHARLALKARPRTLSWLNVVGFACTLFTFFGVNFLLAGLHSYR